MAAEAETTDWQTDGWLSNLQVADDSVDDDVDFTGR